MDTKHLRSVLKVREIKKWDGLSIGQAICARARTHTIHLNDLKWNSFRSFLIEMKWQPTSPQFKHYPDFNKFI